MVVWRMYAIEFTPWASIVSKTGPVSFAGSYKPVSEGWKVGLIVY